MFGRCKAATMPGGKAARVRQQFKVSGGWQRCDTEFLHRAALSNMGQVLRLSSRFCVKLQVPRHLEPF
jgi:hypothetical protein